MRSGQEPSLCVACNLVAARSATNAIAVCASFCEVCDASAMSRSCANCCACISSSISSSKSGAGEDCWAPRASPSFASVAGRETSTASGQMASLPIVLPLVGAFVSVLFQLLGGTLDNRVASPSVCRLVGGALQHAAPIGKSV